MGLPSLSIAKLAVIGLAVATVSGVFLVASLERPRISPPASKTVEASVRRGDDPTYADELRKMTALLQDMRYQFNQAENQRIIDRDQLAQQSRAAAHDLEQQSKAEIEGLKKSLDEAKAALDQKLKNAAAPPTDATWRAEIDRLRTEQEALRKQLASDVNPGGPGAPGTPGSPSAHQPEANRVLNPKAPANPTSSNATTSGGIQLAPGALESLRQLPGMAGFADRLEAQANTERRASGGSEGRPSKSIAGLPDDYVALSPFAGTPRTGAGTATGAQVSYAPKPYPFTVKTGPDGASAIIPVYTIPDAATLVQNATMTPLVGRVPFMGKLRDPFRFKLITGATNLASNGHHVPGIANAVWTGYAVGVREQSCVRAYIDTVTFTFEDGRITTVHKNKGEASLNVSVQDNLGYLTDRWGKPCIRGQYFNNAGAYLRDRSIAAFLDGLANAYANAQITYDTSGDLLSAYVSGNTYQYAAAQGLANSTSDLSKYVAERAQDAFDVIYVPSGVEVQIFVESEIPIDYNTDGRMLQYSYLQRVSDDPLD